MIHLCPQQDFATSSVRDCFGLLPRLLDLPGMFIWNIIPNSNWKVNTFPGKQSHDMSLFNVSWSTKSGCMYAYMSGCATVFSHVAVTWMSKH